MSVRDLIPRTRTTDRPLATERGSDPFLGLQREINRLFDDTFNGFAAPALFRNGESWPRVELKDSDKELQVSAELPGLEEKDVELSLEQNALVIRGEKQHEEKDDERRFSEFHYGRFERRIPLDWEVNPDEVKAQFRNGVLEITVPKSEKAQEQSRRIPIGKG
ncbi:Hsp20/alpha crystallin family protein [Fodinicurvata halophila]|uniref:Hsp20/alpha crystallin family protein n=1 Tax=Fodinicurvata halophila TaxID=1419723 RepID=A0ABV8UPW0_9PROT